MFIELTPDIWAFAAMIGHARRNSNNRTRNANRDRGDERNIHVDLMGSLGELIAYKAFREFMQPKTARAFRDDIFTFAGGRAMKGADLTMDNLNQKTQRLDVKTYECAPNKRFFAINSTKHKQLESCCDGYLCILFPKYGKMAYVVNYVPHSDISNWERKALGKYGDPSFNLPISIFTHQYADNYTLRRLNQAGTHTKDTIKATLNLPYTKSSFANFVPQV
jgi:hypothetical protein